MERTRSLEPIQWKSRWLMSAARQCLDGGGVREEEEQFVNGGRTERERKSQVAVSWMQAAGHGIEKPRAARVGIGTASRGRDSGNKSAVDPH
jgi:hypothetical protein